MKIHIVSLSLKEKNELKLITTKGTHPARVFQRAQILLKADKELKDKTIAKHLDCTVEHVARIRQRYCTYGLERALFDAARSGRPNTFNDKEKTCIVALACTDPPKGQRRWTLDLLVEKAKNQEDINMGRTKVWTILKENDLKPWREKNVVYS